MIDTDEYERTTPELEEFEGETLGDTLTNLLTEIKQLRKQLVTYADFVFWVDVERNVSFDEYERRVGLK